MQPPTAFGARTLFRGDAVTIHDGACAPHATECAAANVGAWPGHRVVFARAAASRAAASRAEVDPTRVLLANAGETLGARHDANGHAWTTLVFCPELVARPFARHAIVAAPSLLLAFHALRGALLDAPRDDAPRDDAARGDAPPIDVEARAVALLQQVLAAARAPEPPAVGRGRAIAEAAREMLARAPGRAHHLADLARALGVSPSHLAHVFRDEIGVPPHRYLLHLRLAVALERLGDQRGRGDASLSALALDLGFATHSHFSAAFRRWCGASPAAVRRVLAARGRGGAARGPRRAGAPTLV